MKKIFNLANGIFFLSLFSVIFLTLDLQIGKMGAVIFRNLHLPVDASIVGWLLLLFSYLMSRKHQTKFFARLGGWVALFFSSRLSDIHMSRFASVARYSALILRSNHIDYNK